MQKRGGSGPAAVLIQKINRGAAFRTGFYWIVLDWKKIRSETSLKKSNPKRRHDYPPPSLALSRARTFVYSVPLFSPHWHARARSSRDFGLCNVHYGCG